MSYTSPDILVLLVWVAWVITNYWVAREKGREATSIVVLSIFAAPFMYLYLLAVPPITRQAKDEA